MVSKATKARVVAAAAPVLPNAVVVLALGLGVYLLVGKVLPTVGDLAIRGGEELAEGTGDFFKGVFGGASQEETTVPRIRTSDDPGIVYQLPDANLSSQRVGSEPVVVLASPQPDYSDFLESPIAFYTVDFDDIGPVVTVTDPHPAIAGPVVYQTAEPSAATELGAEASPYIPYVYGGFAGPQAISQGVFDYNLLDAPADVYGGAKSLLGKLF